MMESSLSMSPMAISQTDQGQASQTARYPQEELHGSESLRNQDKAPEQKR